MAHTFEELKKKTVAELRKIAADIEHEEVQGYTQMNKDHLLKALCGALDIDMHEHHVAKSADKAKIKAKIKDLKNKRDEAVTAHNHRELKLIRRKIHHLKRTLRKTAV
ncbi:hypothetical protein ACFL1R_09305 [Candidatus Latescibacterota bacterium]